MANRLCGEKDAIAVREDRLSTLPDEVILLALSFLPSRQAVRTCVLATRWCTLWKSVPSVSVDADDETHHSPQDLSNFIHNLLRYRDPTPLHECEIVFNADADEDDFHKDFQMWLSYAVLHKVRILRLENWHGGDACWQLSAGTLISQLLTKLILCRVQFEDFSLDVFGCQSLQALEMDECALNIGTMIFPKSLQHLTITRTRISYLDARSLISASGLVTLELAHCSGWTPLLKSLPSLVTAFINAGYHCRDSFRKSSNGDCVLLKGLSGSTNLQLRSHNSMILRKDIKWSPMFSKVKTLLLGEWCMTANFSGLVYFLKHSAILQRLTLELTLSSKEFHIETSEIYKTTEQFLLSKHLKALKVNHVKGDKRINKLLKVLAYHGVPFELIIFEEKKYYNERFSIEHAWQF